MVYGITACTVILRVFILIIIPVPQSGKDKFLSQFVVHHNIRG